jgi:hypothetical protein
MIISVESKKLVVKKRPELSRKLMQLLRKTRTRKSIRELFKPTSI